LRIEAFPQFFFEEIEGFLGGFPGVFSGSRDPGFRGPIKRGEKENLLFL
jgi:hypothetical protein